MLASMVHRNDRRSPAAPAAHALGGLLILSALRAGPALAQDAPGPGPLRLAPVVVTATRTEASPFDVPASIDRIGSELIRDARPQVNISESLGGVAGLLARDRQNYAQDVQISVRGFGARSTFGIRGVRLYVDGIPATLPDGQGQISNVDLGSAEQHRGAARPVLGALRQLVGWRDPGLHRGGRGRADAHHERVRRQRRHAALRRQGERRDRRVRLRRERQRLPHRRLSRPQRRRPQHRQRQAHLARRRQPLDAGRQQRRPAEGAGSARPDAARSSRPTRAASIRRPPPSTPARPSSQTQLGVVYERRVDAVELAARAGLRRPTQHRAVPGDPGGAAGEPASPGRRDRPRPRLPRHRPALDGAHAPRRRAAHAASAASPTTRSTSIGSATRTSSAPTLGVRGRAAPRREQRRRQRRSSTRRARGSSRRAGRCMRACATAACASARTTTTSSARIPTTAAAIRYGATLPVGGLMFAATPTCTSTPPPGAASRRRP